MKTISLILLSLIFSLSASALKQTHFQEQELDVPTRDISIIATDNGYLPRSITAFVGEKLNLFITSSTKRPSCFIIKEHDVFVEANSGDVREASVFLDTIGRFEFYCPTGKISGSLTVIDHPRVQNQKKKREIASKLKRKVRVWRPRDE